MKEVLISLLLITLFVCIVYILVHIYFNKKCPYCGAYMTFKYFDYEDDCIFWVCPHCGKIIKTYD